MELGGWILIVPLLHQLRPRFREALLRCLCRALSLWCRREIGYWQLSRVSDSPGEGNAPLKVLRNERTDDGDERGGHGPS